MEFSSKKAEFLFDKDFTHQIIADAEWFENSIVNQTSLTKIKYLFLVLLDDILPKQSHNEKFGDDRHPLIQYFHKCVANEVSPEIVQEVTHLILSFDFGTTLIEHQLHLISGKAEFNNTFRLQKAKQRKGTGQENQ